MDILTHTFSGFACGTVVASLHQGSLFDKVCIVLAGSIGGCLPDLDAISLWSGFDHYIGSVLSLPSGREIYFGKFWYSHHSFMHSLVGLFSFILTFSLFIILRRSDQIKISSYHLFWQSVLVQVICYIWLKTYPHRQEVGVGSTFFGRFLNIMEEQEKYGGGIIMTFF